MVNFNASWSCRIFLLDFGFCCSPSLLGLLQISAFYFLTFEKAGCTMFTWLVGATIHFPCPNNFPLFLLRFSSPPQKKICSFSNFILLFLLRCLLDLVYQVFIQFPIRVKHYPHYGHDFSAVNKPT